MQYQTVPNIILCSFLFTLVQTASVHKREESEEECKPVVMCPQFCLKVRGKCYVCECEGSMSSYMGGGMNTLHQTYQQPVYQTGNQFQNGGVSGFGGEAMGLSSAPSANGGSGQTDTSYNSWMSHFGLSGSGNEPVQQQTTGDMTYQHYLEPNFQEFYRPVFGAIPGRCIGVDYRCPPKCWRTNTYSGCIECACQASPSNTPASPTTTEGEATTTMSVQTTAKSTTTIEVPLTTPSNSSSRKSNYTNGSLAIGESKEQTTITPQTTTEGKPLNMESLSSMSGADLILMIMDGMKRHKTLQQMLQQITMQKTQEIKEYTTTPSTTTTTTTTQGTTNTISVTSTEPTTSTETVHKNLQLDNCPVVDMSCPSECLIFDPISRCTLCSCMEKLLPRENSSDGCEDIDASCPSHCIAIDDYLCPVCKCLSTTVSPTMTSTTSHTQAVTTSTEAPTREPVTFSQEIVCNVQQSISECSRECLKFDNNFCPICSCDKPTTKSPVSDYFCQPISLTCPIKCIAVDDDFCPVCRCSGQDATSV